LLNWNVAVATWVPSGALRRVVMFADAPGPASAFPVVDGAGAPVQIGGTVPGVDDVCSGDEQALSRTTELATINGNFPIAEA
jgi:hypothetical protein